MQWSICSNPRTKQLSVESESNAARGSKKRLSSKMQGSAHSSDHDPAKEVLVSEKLNSFRELTAQAPHMGMQD